MSVRKVTKQMQVNDSKLSPAAYLALKPALLVVLVLSLVFGYRHLLLSSVHEPFASTAIIICAVSLMIYVFLLPYFEDLAKVLKYLRDIDAPDKSLPILSGVIPELTDELQIITSNFKERCEALRKEAQDARTLLATVPTVIFIVDADMKVISISELAKHKLGADVVDQHINTTLQNEELLNGLSQAFHYKKSSKLSTVVDFAQTPGLYDVYIEYIEPAVGAPQAIVMINDANNSGRSEAVITDFIANVSHEIRTPLTSIVGAIDVLEYTNWDIEAVKEFMPIIRGQTDRMCALANQLITLLNVERTQYGYEFVDVNIQELFQLVLKQVDASGYDADIKMLTEGTGDLPAVYGNPWELEHAFYQIIGNAVLHSGGQEVQVSAGVTQIKGLDMLYVSVSDKGEGIPQEHIDRIMEKFYRIDASRSRKAGGSGLGLAIVKEIVLKHRGSISVQNRETGGSVFTIYLPIARQSVE